MTLTQLGAFVLVAGLGSGRAAAGVLGVSGSAASKATASQMARLAAEAPAAIRPAKLRLLVSSTIAGLIAAPPTEAFTKRWS